ncbi:MAG: tRNA (guanosine(37)-N1)-methyltransferase TrmD [Candidatus Solincola sediminis]|uniref:tRNA (guanine-N(1)-)-methyltransferase n=1 Tax=Candidatus Solincola sediminis TaxID=1797199 RepID=A0A1F2WFS0_9ACTN|nr:MAG: tRNA (guanosine(37)-N1)-methyltransferase TrmD [Candidatus Solincola sediminis]OFW59989.1 MAG: tRNA (guanosine(37)-N1)-methyltransferase TrmD [Candidatus Solincola sediminis]
MRIDVYSIFPGIFESPLRESLLGKAIESGVIDLRLHDIRDYAEGRHRQVDDAPFGGGPGMVMKPEPIFRAVTETLGYRMDRLDELKSEVEVILLTPSGETFDQEKANQLAGREHLALICGRYEGVDERVREHLCTRALSVGDYVLSGGEFAALIVIDAVARLVPGVVGNEASLADESFSRGLLEYPQYTRPADFNSWKVPEIVLSGNHGEIEKWRCQVAKESTRKTRPELSGIAQRKPDEV